jgi:transketolase
MRKTFVDSLLGLAKKDPKILLVVGDLGYGVVDEFKNQLPEQFINFGINEQSMMSAAAGLAQEGFRPFVYSIGNFPTARCLEQIRNDVCYMNLPVTIVSVGSGFAYGTAGYSHHLIEDLSMLRGLPNLAIYSPSDSNDANDNLEEIMKNSKPSYLRLGKGGEIDLNAKTSNKLTGHRTYQEGPDGLLLFMGTIGNEVLAAGKLLDGFGIHPTIASISHIDKRKLKRTLSHHDGRGTYLLGRFWEFST